MKRRRSAQVIPSARRLIQSLRDLGYDTSAALSELVDNSIAANARVVEIDTSFEGEDSWIRITDDGSGMDGRQLHEAMRFGTRRSYSEDDLGKFGLGLKAASLSQCRRLTVASRVNANARLNILCWDLDHIEKSDRWELLRLRPHDCPLVVHRLLGKGGTVVLWEGLDRVLRYSVPEGRRAEAHFTELSDEIRSHLSMTFHRFIGREARRRRSLTISLNGRSVTAWDPFARSEPETISVPQQRLKFVLDGRRHSARVRAYVLPVEAAFTTSEAHRLAAGPKLWTRQQGLYIYRNGRLIQAGGWSRLRTLDEHTKLARIAVDIPSGTDGAFELNVLKTQVRIPAGIRSQLAAITSSVCRLADETYRRPRQPSEPHDHSELSNERLAAVRALVRMVVGAAEQVIGQECSNLPEVGSRVIHRLREMELTFSSQLAAELGVGSQSGSE